MATATADQQVSGTVTAVNGRTYPEFPAAVAVDFDGDQVVVWTATNPTVDPVAGHWRVDRVYFQLYNADGTAVGTAVAVTQTLRPASSALTHDDQRYAEVACDADGDFVVTWTEISGLQTEIHAAGSSPRASQWGRPSW